MWLPRVEAALGLAGVQQHTVPPDSFIYPVARPAGDPSLAQHRQKRTASEVLATYKICTEYSNVHDKSCGYRPRQK